jgi:hypothetical protein
MGIVQDEDIIVWKIIAGAVIVVVNSLGVFLPLFYSEWFLLQKGLSRFNSLFAGILFSTSMIQMLSDSERTPSVDSDGPDHGFPIVHFFLGVGFLLTMAMQWTIEGVKRFHHNRKALETMSKVDILPNLDHSELIYEQGYRSPKSHQPNLWTLLSVFLVEGVLTGSAVGIQTRSASVIILTLSAASTDWIEAVIFSMSIAVAFLEVEKDRRSAIKYAVLYLVTNIFATVFWIILFSSISLTDNIEVYASIVTSLLSGSFLYITCIDLLAKEIHECEINGSYPNFRQLLIKMSMFSVGFLFVTAIVYLEDRE